MCVCVRCVAECNGCTDRYANAMTRVRKEEGVMKKVAEEMKRQKREEITMRSYVFRGKLR